MPRLTSACIGTVIAEKFEAMVKLGTLNTRMKDFSISGSSRAQFSLTGPELAQAIEKTFANRGTQLEADPVALTSSFMAADSTQKQWGAFLKRSQLDNAPKTLDDARDRLHSFLLPLATALS